MATGVNKTSGGKRVAGGRVKLYTGVRGGVGEWYSSGVYFMVHL